MKEQFAQMNCTAGIPAAGLVLVVSASNVPIIVNSSAIDQFVP
jgi:hypothetical protein